MILADFSDEKWQKLGTSSARIIFQEELTHPNQAAAAAAQHSAVLEPPQAGRHRARVACRPMLLLPMHALAATAK